MVFSFDTNHSKRSKLLLAIFVEQFLRRTLYSTCFKFAAGMVGCQVFVSALKRERSRNRNTMFATALHWYATDTALAYTGDIQFSVSRGTAEINPSRWMSRLIPGGCTLTARSRTSANPIESVSNPALLATLILTAIKSTSWSPHDNSLARQVLRIDDVGYMIDRTLILTIYNYI